MSIYCVGLCLQTITSLTLTQKFVLLALCEKADNDGTNAWPSVATLARYAECSERTVQRCLGELKAKEWIAVTRRATAVKPAVYSINIGRFTEGCHPVTPKATPVTPRGDRAMSPDPSSTRPTTGVNGLDVASFLAWWIDIYKEKRNGTPYQLRKGRDAGIVQHLLRAYGLERLKTLAELLLVTDERFIDSTDRGLAILSTKAMWLDHLLREHGR